MALDLPSYLLGKSKGGSGGTSDYSQLTNKPSINGVTLSGNKTSEDLGISGGDTFYLGNTSDYTTDNRLDITNLPKGLYAIHYESYLYCKATINGTTYEFTLAPTPGDTPTNAIAYLEIRNSITEDYLPNTIIGIFEYSVVSESAAKIRTYGLTIRYEGTSINASSGSSQVINAVTTNGSQTISGKKTFSTLPESSVTPTTDNQLVNKKYVDDNAGGSSGVVITDSNKNEQSTIDALNVEYQKYLNGKATDIYLEYTLPAYQGGTVFRLPAYFKNFGAVVILITNPIWDNNTGSNNASWQFVFRASLNLTNETITTIQTISSDQTYISHSNGAILKSDNNWSYTPTGDYNPAHKLYVDTAISNAIGDINTVLATLTTPSNNGGN